FVIPLKELIPVQVPSRAVLFVTTAYLHPMGSYLPIPHLMPKIKHTPDPIRPMNIKIQLPILPE
ncbi:hypothetical protein PSTG_17821, partial [Puccinia striiformis f. sp. tritici PST-78]